MGCLTILGQGIGTDCNKSSEADILLAQAALEKARQKQQVAKEWTPLQIVGVVAGSLLAITIMVAVLIKVKKSKS